MTTKKWAMLTVLFTTLLTSAAQLLWKKGSANLDLNLGSILFNHYLIFGILLYLIGGALLIISFRGGEVSVLYPIFATSYVWVSFMSIRFLNEEMNTFKWLGIISIIAGIIFIGLGSKSTVPAGAL